MHSTKYTLRHGPGRWAQLDTIVTLRLDKGKLTAESLNLEGQERAHAQGVK